MTDRRKSQASREHAERLALLSELMRSAERAALSRLASSLAHALGTPLNVIAGRAAMIGMSEDNAGRSAENARIIEERVRAIAHMIEDVLEFARAGKPVPELLEPQGLIRRVVGLLEPLADEREISLTAPGTLRLEAALPAERVLQVLTLLTCVGIRHGDPGGAIEIAVSCGHAEPPAGERGRAQPGQHVRFTVRCATVQLSSEYFTRIQEPWFEPVLADPGLSLDLAICYGIAREYRGWVEASDEPGSGTVFEVYWPV